MGAPKCVEAQPDRSIRHPQADVLKPATHAHSAWQWVSYLQLKSEDGIGLNTNSKMGYEPSGNTAVLNQVEPETLAVTILMPCLNEAETLGICIRKALKAIRDLNLHG